MFGPRVIRQYEQGIVLRWGKLQPKVRDPGLTWVNPISDRLHKVNMQIVVSGVTPQAAITRENVTVMVDTVVYYRVLDLSRALVNVQNYHPAVAQVAQTSLRSIIGKSDLNELLSNREVINAQLQTVIDEPTEGRGVRVERVEVKDVSLPGSMKRQCLARPKRKGTSSPSHCHRRGVPSVAETCRRCRSNGRHPNRAAARSAPDGRGRRVRKEQHSGDAIPGGNASVLGRSVTAGIRGRDRSDADGAARRYDPCPCAGELAPTTLLPWCRRGSGRRETEEGFIDSVRSYPE